LTEISKATRESESRYETTSASRAVVHHSAPSANWYHSESIQSPPAGVRQVANALTEQSSRYESVVAVEYPREGVYTLGFVTGDGPRQLESVAGGETDNVFLPNSPNPTGGRLLIVPAKQVHQVDVSVRRGIRLLMTTGIAEKAEEVVRLQGESDLPPSEA
jgi:uncharacterized membrane protein